MNRTFSTRRKPGYTLLELLISITIFSGVIILALGSFARSTASVAKSNLVREKSEAARSVMDQISNDFRYITKDANPHSCPPTPRPQGYCIITPDSGYDVFPGFAPGELDPLVFTSPHGLAMLLKYPGQDTYVLKVYFLSPDRWRTLSVTEKRGCTLPFKPGYTEPCRADISRVPVLLDTKYYLHDDDFTYNSAPYIKVFSGQLDTATNSGFLRIKLTIKPRSTADCRVAGTCFELSTTLSSEGNLKND